MAENKSYSFYVSDNDKSLNDFIAAQSNLSMTIRLLLKGFICNYEDKYPDVVNMDLRELISNTGVDEERLAEIAAMEKQSVKGKERVSHEEQERLEAETNAEAEVEDEDENKAEDEQSSEVVIDLGNADFDDELTDTVDDIDDNQDKPDEAENQSEMPAEESIDISEDPADMLGEMPGDATDDIPDDVSDDDQNDSDDEEQSDTADDAQGEPEREPEDEPKKRNLREEYNKKQSGDEMVDADDLMSFMGDGPGL